MTDIGQAEADAAYWRDHRNADHDRREHMPALVPNAHYRIRIDDGPWFDWYGPGLKEETT